MKNFEECKRETNAINAKLTRVTPDGQMYIEASQTQTEANRTPDPKTARRIRVFVIPARPPAARARIEEPSPDGTSAGR